MRDGGQGSRERDRRPRGRSRGSERGSTAAGRISTKPGLSSPTCLSGRAFRPPRSGHRLLPAEGCGWWAVAQGPKQSSLPAVPRRFSLTRPLLPSRPVPSSPPPRVVPALPDLERSGGAALTGAPSAAGCLALGTPSSATSLFRAQGKEDIPMRGNASLTIHCGPFGGCPRPVPGTPCRGS